MTPCSAFVGPESGNTKLNFMIAHSIQQRAHFVARNVQRAHFGVTHGRTYSHSAHVHLRVVLVEEEESLSCMSTAA